MVRQWIRCEQHRLHVVERWPDSPSKEVVLTAIRATLQGLLSGLEIDRSQLLHER